MTLSQRMTAEQFRSQKAVRKRNKFGARVTWVCSACEGHFQTGEEDGRCSLCGHLLIRFASRAEAERWCELRMGERLGVIRNLLRQVSYPLHAGGVPLKIRSDRYANGRLVVYRADFDYELRNGADNWEHITEDMKGQDTPLSAHKRAHVEAEYGIRVLVTRATKQPARRQKRRAA